MGQYQVERRLTLLYATVIICGIIICACSGIVWNYWKYALDVCPDENCGCILYGKSGISFFIGGHAGYCYWIIYGPLLPIAFSLIMVIFHFIRVYINDFGKYEDEDTRTVEQRDGEVIIMTTRDRAKPNDSISYCWIPNAVIASILVAYTFAHAVILTDGYYKTCNWYRLDLVKTLRASGNHVSVIHSRLSCSAIFDFMDYLQPDVVDHRRGDFINTGLALLLAIISSWLTVCSLIYITVLTSIRAHKDRNFRTCCK